MIILILIIIAILFFVSCNLLVSNKTIHYLCSAISLNLLIISIGAIVINFKYHYGMKLNNVTYTRKLQPTSNRAPFLIYKELGTRHRHKIVLYRKRIHSKHVTHTPISSAVSNKIETSQHAKLVTINKKWCYRNSFYKLMFKIAYKPSNHYTTNVFYVPKTWRVLSVEQVKQVKAKAKKLDKQYKNQAQTPLAKQEMKAKVQQQAQAEISKQMMKNPKMTTKQKANLTNKIIKHNKLEMKKQIEQQIMQKALN